MRKAGRPVFSYSGWMLPGSDGVPHISSKMILGVLSLAALAYAVLSSAVIPALPTFQRSLGASETGVTWLLTGFLLSASVGTAIIGKLGDMYGKKRPLVWTLLILAAGTLLAAVASSLAVLIVARIIQGVAGGIFPLSFSIIRDEFPADRVAGSIGLMSAILGIGSGLGLVVGGLIDEHLSWHWLFWIPLPAMVLAAAGCVVAGLLIPAPALSWRPGSPRPARRRAIHWDVAQDRECWCR